MMTDEDKFGAGASVFVDVGAPFFFYIKKFKLNFRPAGYSPILYAEPNFTYIFKNIESSGTLSGILLELQYNMQIYTHVPFDAFEDPQKLLKLNAMGIDFSGGVEYPLFTWLDLGVNLKNIPIVPSTMKHYMKMEDKISIDTSELNLIDLINGGELPDSVIYSPEDFELVYGEGSKIVLRPFKMVFSANYRPFNKPILSIIPLLGFSINPIYVNPASIEAGIKARYDFANMFIATIGFGYEDHVWKNSLDFVFNFRAFELDIGVSMQSANFVKSWQAAGVGFNLALKFGW
jgi:hypothetical protein